MIYLDNAATSGYKPQGVINAVNFALKNLSANPGRSGHKASMDAANSVYKAREKVSRFFGGSAAENVIFTLNCTESINFVIKGILLESKSTYSFIVLSTDDSHRTIEISIKLNSTYPIINTDTEIPASLVIGGFGFSVASSENGTPLEDLGDKNI